MKAEMTHQLYRNFASPYYSAALKAQGLDIKTPYYWRVSEGYASLNTHAFDLDDHYKQAFANIDHFNKPELLPAFQVEDLTMLIPDYFISRDGINHTISCDKLFGLRDTSSPRLADALAEMVLQCFKMKILNLLSASKKFQDL